MTDLAAAFAPTLFAGKVALVTGSTSGIGLATAELLGRAGARVVVLNGRDEATGQAEERRLAALMPSTAFRFIAADYADQRQVDTLFARVADSFGGLDILVHTATGGGPPDLVHGARPRRLAGDAGGQADQPDALLQAGDPDDDGTRRRRHRLGGIGRGETGDAR
jgi:NAD(P)-dependent dehydrogenase (short-subunit alcohol dehydrogenase family)